MVPLFPSLAMVKHVHIAPRQATSCDARTATWAYGTDHCRPGPIFPHAPLPNFSGRWRQVTPGTNSCERKAKEHQSNTGFIVTTSVLPPFFNLAVSVRCKGSLTPLNILSGIFCTKHLWSYLVFCLPTLCHGPKSASMMSRHLWKSLRRFWRSAGRPVVLPAFLQNQLHDFEKNAFCLVKTFQAIVDLVVIFFEATLFRLPGACWDHSLRSPGTNFVTKVDPNFLPETQGRFSTSGNTCVQCTSPMIFASLTFTSTAPWSLSNGTFKA